MTKFFDSVLCRLYRLLVNVFSTIRNSFYIRMEKIKVQKALCEMYEFSVTFEIKRFVIEELQKYYAELDRLHDEEQKSNS